jgi:hypothetical protein
MDSHKSLALVISSCREICGLFTAKCEQMALRSPVNISSAMHAALREPEPPDTAKHPRKVLFSSQMMLATKVLRLFKAKLLHK